ncbi:MAG: hypothetical protein H6555_06130 [Lewinellaceae bacterium]|nr:hypothetical protein [Lewinellaceae bacterium]
MEEHHNPLATLQEIRHLMERSSRFISLSGLSGVIAGTFALLGALAAFLFLDTIPFTNNPPFYFLTHDGEGWREEYLIFFLLDGLLVLIGAIGGALFFTTRQARRSGQPVWDALSRRLLINLGLPIVTGGIFIIALYLHHLNGFIAPATLIFYGLGLINGSKYTLDDIRYLGLCEIALGLLGMFLPGYGLELWAIGFGILHIIYGVLMYNKYERKP